MVACALSLVRVKQKSSLTEDGSFMIDLHAKTADWKGQKNWIYIYILFSCIQFHFFNMVFEKLATLFFPLPRDAH